MSDAAKRYGPEHPRMIQAKTELEAAKEGTRKQIEVVVQGLAKEYEVARASEQAAAESAKRTLASIG